MGGNTEGVEFGSQKTKCESLLCVHLQICVKWWAKHPTG